MRGILFILFAILSQFAIALGALADGPQSIYVATDGKNEFVFDFDIHVAGFGMTPEEQTRYRAKGGVIRDGGSSFEITDCSTPNRRCLNLEDFLVFGVDVPAFMRGEPYEIVGTKFVPSCQGTSGPPQCRAGAITFTNARTTGFFVFSMADGVIAIGINPIPENELELVYVLKPGTRGILSQK